VARENASASSFQALVAGAALGAVQHVAYLVLGILRPSNAPTAA
jgi:hypothetical protein